jgi:hypothetical protein
MTATQRRLLNSYLLGRKVSLSVVEEILYKECLHQEDEGAILVHEIVLGVLDQLRAKQPRFQSNRRGGAG